MKKKHPVTYNHFPFDHYLKQLDLSDWRKSYKMADAEQHLAENAPLPVPHTQRRPVSFLPRPKKVGEDETRTGAQKDCYGFTFGNKMFPYCWSLIIWKRCQKIINTNNIPITCWKQGPQLKERQTSPLWQILGDYILIFSLISLKLVLQDNSDCNSWIGRWTGHWVYSGHYIWVRKVAIIKS